MIIDLAGQDTDRSIITDTLIIGGGIAGLLLACKLQERNTPVVVLESGGRNEGEAQRALNDVVQMGDPYRGATEGRARCLGGTSTLWGGAMLPFMASDFHARPYLDLPSWPVSLDELRPYIGELEALFGIDAGSYDEDFVDGTSGKRHIPTGDPDLMVRFAKWPTFRKRNLATLLRRKIEDSRDLSIWLNATVTNFHCDDAAGRVNAVVARHVGGRTVRVHARNVVVCAGAIESTRLLLLLDRQSGGNAFRDCSAIGRYFHDHVSVHAADITARDPHELNRLAGFRFAGSTMRSPRFELSPSAQAADNVGSAFGHITFKAEGETGFDALRTCMRSLQRSGRLCPRTALKVANDIPYLAKAAYWRMAHKQLRWPERATYQLRILAEQKPCAENRITLSTERDALGIPQAAIDWRPGRTEKATINAFARRFDGYWSRHGLNRVGSLEWRNGARSGTTSGQFEDVFHPGGTTRMGLDGRTAVLDRNLKAFGVTNLWVASTSAFPSGASANPTMMLMLFTLRLADELAARRREPNPGQAAAWMPAQRPWQAASDALRAYFQIPGKT